MYVSFYALITHEMFSLFTMSLNSPRFPILSPSFVLQEEGKDFLVYLTPSTAGAQSSV